MSYFRKGLFIFKYSSREKNTEKQMQNISSAVILAVLLESGI